MSLLIKDSERGQAEWNRKARDATNGLIRRLAGCGPTAFLFAIRTFRRGRPSSCAGRPPKTCGCWS